MEDSLLCKRDLNRSTLVVIEFYFLIGVKKRRYIDIWCVQMCRGLPRRYGRGGLAVVVGFYFYFFQDTMKQQILSSFFLV